MSTLTLLQARTQAMALVTAGVQSNSIKLSGTGGAANPKAAAKNDVEYLSALIDGLAAKLVNQHIER